MGTKEGSEVSSAPSPVAADPRFACSWPDKAALTSPTVAGPAVFAISGIQNELRSLFARYHSSDIIQEAQGPQGRGWPVGSRSSRFKTGVLASNSVFPAMSRDSGAHLSIQATNRTSEFLSAVESQRLKSASLAPESKQRLLQGKDATSSGSQRSEFARHALSISKDLQSTTAKLEKLALRSLSSPLKLCRKV